MLESAITYTEAELVQGLRNRDQKVFGYVYDKYSPALYGVVVKVLNDPGMAGDTLQEIYLKIWRNFDHYDESKGRLFTWMLNIARNTAIDVLRSRAHKLGERVQPITDDTALTVNPVVDHVGFVKVLEKLNKEQRILIDLAYYKGCTQEEISKILEIPLGTVKTRMRNAIIQLRNILRK